MAIGLYRLRKQLREESEDIGESAGKRSLWSKIGMGVGGLIAAGLTGGAASPLVAALMAGGGTYVGGKIGESLAKKKFGKFEDSGLFFKNTRKDTASSISDMIGAGALKSGLSAGLFSALGKGLELTKSGMPSPGKEGFQFKDIFKSGTSQHVYKDNLLGKVGKAIDFKGSAIADLGRSIRSSDLYGNIETMGRADTYKLDNWSDLRGSGMTPTEYLDKVEGIQDLELARSGMGTGPMPKGNLWDAMQFEKLPEGAQIPSIDYSENLLDTLSTPEKERYSAWNQLSAKYGGQQDNIITYGSRFDPITGERIN